jgi:ribonucleoside-diphosphate reductase alpha chain
MSRAPSKAFMPAIEPPAQIQISENGRQVLHKRYLRKDLDGQPVETIEGMFRRVARAVAEPDAAFGYDAATTGESFYALLSSLRFFPNSPTFTGAATPLGQLAACFVLPISDDLGKQSDGIFQTLRDAALIQQTGGGNGFSFSRLRPKGDSVASSAGVASGPVGFLRVYDTAFGEVAQGGTRRGANMAVLRVDHPDIEEFIACKQTEGQISNFNISVGITDAFMEAVEADEEFNLVNPRDGSIAATLCARDLFQTIITYAHHNGEPGALFLDVANRQNPVPHLYQLEATNPCFVGSTRVATEHGFLTMAELAKLGGRVLIAIDDRAAPEWVRGNWRLASPVVLTRRDAAVLSLRTVHGYEVTATPDHRFLTPDRGYVPLSDLQPGDRLLLQSVEGPWSKDYALPNRDHIADKMAVMGRGGDPASGKTVTRRDFSEQYASVPSLWSHRLGIALGWLVGDGWLSPSSGSPVGFAFRIEEDGFCGVSTLQPILQQWFGPGHVHDRGNLRQLTYGRLPYEFFSSLGIESVPATEKRVPSSLWSAPRDAVLGFLSGLFSADGSVQISEEKQDCTVRLASSSLGLLQDVQLLLANLAIVSRIYRRSSRSIRSMPDSRGSQKAYQSAARFELVIGRSNRDRFAHLIGFAHPLKQARLERHQAGLKRGAYRERFEVRVLDVQDAGSAQVYDLTEEATSSFIANGLVVHNCGEQWLGPYENCCLGSVNLAQHVTSNGQVDWEKLRISTVVSTRFLDNVVDANKYVPTVPQLREAALRARRIGLGMMGLGDLMYALGVRYGSEAGQELAAQVMEFIRYHSMKTSIELARERGPFAAIAGSIYDPASLQWAPPVPLRPYTHDWGRPKLDWNEIVAGIRVNGIRNAAQTTVAPTGTIGTVAGCEGYGCEPVFALAYTRTVKDGDRDLRLTYTSPLFEAALERAGLDEETRREIAERVSATGSCQSVSQVPEAIRRVFVVSQDITAEEHVWMQAAIQAFVDNSISKTINFPEGASVEEVGEAYRLAWRLGCKGLTVYVTGSRREVVLETRATLEHKGRKTAEPRTGATFSADQGGASEKGSGATGDSAAHAGLASPPASAYPAKRPRPGALSGVTYRKETPLGTAFVTVNVNGGDFPFEVFLNVGKAGSDVASVSEAVGRLISLILRLPSPLNPNERLKQVVDQLAGIGGGRSLGFGANRVRSLPDAVAQVLREHLNSQFDAIGEDEDAPYETPTEQLPLPIGDRPIGDLCPDCGQAAFIPTEGCRKCYVCGYSEC